MEQLPLVYSVLIKVIQILISPLKSNLTTFPTSLFLGPGDYLNLNGLTWSLQFTGVLRRGMESRRVPQFTNVATRCSCFFQFDPVDLWSPGCWLEVISFCKTPERSLMILPHDSDSSSSSSSPRWNSSPFFILCSAVKHSLADKILFTMLLLCLFFSF